MSNVELHVFNGNDLNGVTSGGPVWTCTDEDPWLKRLTMRIALNQLGSAQFALDRKVAEDLLSAGVLGPAQFIRFLVPAISATRYIWGIELDDRRQLVVSQREGGGEELVLGGNGPLAILDRAISWHEKYGDTGGKVDPDNGVWRFPETYKAGRILHILLEEDEHYPDGAFLAAVTRSFDNNNDTAGAPWTEDFAERFEVGIKDSILTSAWSLQESVESMDYWMDCGTVAAPHLRFDAWESPIGRDLTGIAFASGVVLFREGVNILGNLTVVGRSHRKASHVLVDGDDGSHAVAVRPGWDPGEYQKAAGLDKAGISNVATLQRRGRRFITSQDLAEEEISFRFATGFDPVNGFYFPGEAGTSGHVWPGDSVSLKTLTEGSSSLLDYDFAAKRLSGITMELGPAADDSTATRQARSWRCYADAQVERESPTHPGTGSGRATRHRHPPNPRLCERGEIAGEVLDESHANELSFGYIDPTDGSTEVELWHNTGLGVMATTTDVAGIKLWYLRDHSCGFLFTSDDPTHCRITRHTDGRLLLRWLDGEIDCSRPPGTGAAPGAGDGAFNNIGIAVEVVGGDGHPDLIGAGTRASRCGHAHHVLRTYAPTVDDDTSEGYPPTTLWTQVDDVESPTTIVATWLLVDDTEGAAVWLETGAIGDFLEKVGGEKHTVNTVAASGTTETLDLADGNLHDVTLTGDCTFTFTGATADVGCYLTLILRQDATGGRAVTWPASVAWPDDTPPLLSTDANDVSILSFLSRDGGTTWFGTFQGGGTNAGSSERRILLADGRATPFTFNDMLQMDDGSDFMWSD